MNKNIRPRRSALYMPGSNARALEKGRSLPADVLIMDLEDAVAPSAKVEARSLILEALESDGYNHKEIVIRVNGLDTPWGYDDLIMAARSKADAILLPKVESADTIRRVESILRAVEAPESLAIWCMLETPRGILHAEEIADASSLLEALVMGSSDLAMDLHCMHTEMRLPMLNSLSTCVLAARAAGLTVLDGVYLDLNDDDGYRKSCRAGLEMGFDGKTLIHPKTIKVANEVFAPSEEEVSWARKIIAAYHDAVSKGSAVTLVDGKLIENLHVNGAERTLKLFEVIESRGE